MAAHRRLCASRLSAVGFLVAAAHGQVLSTTVDILSPGDEGYDGIPENRLVLDVFTDIAITDMWVSAGLRVVTSEGACCSITIRT